MSKNLEALANMSPTDAERLGAPLRELRDGYRDYQKRLVEARRIWERNAAPEASLHDYEHLRVADVRISSAHGGRSAFRSAIDREGPSGPTFQSFEAAARMLATKDETTAYYADQFAKLAPKAATRLEKEATKNREAVADGVKALLALSDALDTLERQEAALALLSGADVTPGRDSEVVQSVQLLRAAASGLRTKYGLAEEIPETPEDAAERLAAHKVKLDNLVARVNVPVGDERRPTADEWAYLEQHWDELEEWQQITVRAGSRKHDIGVELQLKNAANPKYDAATGTVRGGL